MEVPYRIVAENPEESPNRTITNKTVLGRDFLINVSCAGLFLKVVRHTLVIRTCFVLIQTYFTLIEREYK